MADDKDDKLWDVLTTIRVALAHVEERLTGIDKRLLCLERREAHSVQTVLSWLSPAALLTAAVACWRAFRE